MFPPIHEENEVQRGKVTGPARVTQFVSQNSNCLLQAVSEGKTFISQLCSSIIPGLRVAKVSPVWAVLANGK